MNYEVKNGIYNLDYELSELEDKLIADMCELLRRKGFRYLSVPVSLENMTVHKQGMTKDTLNVDSTHDLGGSAEQGILQYFSGKEVETSLIYAKNTCFRTEPKYHGLKHVKEFYKVEQFCFCEESTWRDNFDLLLSNAEEFLNKYDIEYRVVDVTESDEGYHKLKYDIEVKTETYGWLETHSCTYFGEEQTKRFGITGSTHTISNTGVATPRILIPFIERNM